MHGRYRERRVWRLNSLPVQASYTDVLSQHRLRGGGSHAYQYLWSYCVELSFQPRIASLNFGLTWLLVNPSLATLGCRPLEMLHDICNVDVRAINASLN